jgi:EpsD family peptidyl-prolyl cis-trans isomerase
MRMRRITLVTGCAFAMLALSGCKREATGQVAAVVNGEEITLQEVNQEIGQAQLPKNVDRKAIQQAALQKIIDRRLVAQAARKDGIDKEPEYVIRQRQIDELLLIQMLGQKAARTLRMPEPATIDKYVADHPTKFGERTIYLLDRVQFPMPSNPDQIRALKDDHTMEAVANRLTGMGVAFQRSGGQLDSAMVPPQMMARIKALPPGEPFLVPENGMVTVAAVTDSKPAPLLGANARPIAAQLMRSEEMAKILDQRLKTARDGAKIEYQSGFAPTKVAAGPAAAPAKP